MGCVILTVCICAIIVVLAVVLNPSFAHMVLH